MAWKTRKSRYRQRYLDLIANDEVKRTFLLRSEILHEIRNFLQRTRFHRSGNAHDAGHPRRRGGPAVHHASQCAGVQFLPAHRLGALSETAARRRIGSGLRDRPQFPQRRPLAETQSRVHHAGSVSGLRRLRVDDGVGAVDGVPRGGEGAGHACHRAQGCGRQGRQNH